MPVYNLIEYSSNYFETEETLWFYLIKKATDFDTSIANTDDFKPFGYKARLLGNTEADGTNGILKKCFSSSAFTIFKQVLDIT